MSHDNLQIFQSILFVYICFLLQLDWFIDVHLCSTSRFLVLSDFVIRMICLTSWNIPVKYLMKSRHIMVFNIQLFLVYSPLQSNDIGIPWYTIPILIVILW